MQDINLSKQHREELIELCETLKTKSPEDVASINNIIKFIRDQKYGLLFEKHQEQVDVDLLTKIPVFVEDKSKRISLKQTDLSEQDLTTHTHTHEIPHSSQYNFLLEGDNLHSLKLLEKTHKGAIDVVYIDPPYNTGKKDFTYNDKNVGVDDGYRHSKWLSFMKERLEIARNCLSKTGLIFISIDEYEYAQLKLLCDEIFDEANYVENFIWIKNSTKNNSLTTSTNHEYVLCYAKDKSAAKNDKKLFRVNKEGFDEVITLVETCKKNNLTPKETEFELKKFLKQNEHWKGITSYGNVDEDYNIYTSSDASAPNGKGPHYDVIHPVTCKPCKIPSRGWGCSKETMLELIKNKRILFGEDETKVPRVKRFLLDVDTEVIKSTIFDNTEGKKELIKVFNIATPTFTNPKPTTLLKTILKCVSKNAIILDFFAGSGTTGQAVLELNKEDGGCRKFILCTNNENNICEEITYKRLKTVITGIREDGSIYSDGIPANLKYFKAEMIERNDDDLDEKLLDASIPLIELENFEDVEDENPSIFIAYSDEDLDEFEENFDKENNLVKTIYVAEDVCLSETQEQLFAFNDIKVKTIPNNFFREL